MWIAKYVLPSYPLGPNDSTTKIMTLPVGSTVIIIDQYTILEQGRGFRSFEAIVYLCEFGIKDCNVETFYECVSPFPSSDG